MVKHLLHRVPQRSDISPTTLSVGRFRIRYTYFRSSETRAHDDIGQDYLLFTGSPDKLAFCLCDGVSQSFYGDLAARFLGDHLVDWLWDLPALPTKNLTARKKLSSQLKDWIVAARMAVEVFPIPFNAPPLLKGVLEEKRSIGSESMFVCGRWDVGHQTQKKTSLMLFWLGDSRFQLWKSNELRSDATPTEWDSMERWSTLNGVKGGEPNVCIEPKGKTDRILVFSDGMVPIESMLASADDEQLNQFLVDLNETPTSDDASLFDIALVPEP